jgi:transposase InsO family protein
MRDTIVAMFHLMGPGVGLRTLQAMFPETARRELEDLHRRYRDVHLTRTSMLVHVLRWRKAGSVWAMDFTEPPTPIEGAYVKILVVRDLSSGKTLLSLPVEAETSKSVRDALVALFVEYGVPLVIKSDNGSPFVAEETENLLTEWRVLQLLSPPGTPEYNGACEAGIGGLKTRAHHESARNDRPGEWTCDDVEAARLMANQTGRPWGALGLTPDQAWSQRRPIWEEDRKKLQELVMHYAEEARGDQGYLPGIDLGPAARAAVHRVAISRALVALGILEVRRRRIPLAI